MSDRREMEANAARIFELSGDLACIFGADGRFLHANPTCIRILGWSLAELNGMYWPDLCHPDDLSASRVAESSLSDARHLTDFVNRLRRQDGSYIWISWNATRDVDTGYICAVGRDVTASHERSDQMQQLASVLEHMGESILVTNLEGVITFVNPAFEQISGYSRDEAIGERPSILKSGMHMPAFYEELWRTLLAGRVWKGRFINRRRDGTMYTGESTISPVFNARGDINSFVDVQRDITEVLRLEEHLHQSQKLESIGRMAGGVAHDFNNLLTVITGQAQLLQLRRRDDVELRAALDNVLLAAGRAVDLTRQLLAFSRRQPLSLQVLNLDELVTEFSSILQRMISERIELRTHVAPDLWRVYADRVQIDQIVMNLALNARDAMAEGGVLDLYLENVEVSAEMAAKHSDLYPSAYVCLSMVDTGHGIAADVMPNIFEPFFSTKDASKGTGLGLATVYGIARQHCGAVTVESTPGVGSTFRVYLPRHRDGARTTTTDEQANAVQGTESVLVVEDDDAIRSLISEILRQYGYQVQVAKSAEEALLLAAAGEPLDLLLADVVLPGMNGQALFAVIHRDRPTLRVLYISGYLHDHDEDTPRISSRSDYVQKPFTIQHLLSRVRSSLDA